MTIEEIQQANQEAGQHFFDPDTVRFFNSRIHDEVYEGPGGIYFVTSEKPAQGVRRYTVRRFEPDTGKVKNASAWLDLTTREARR